MNSKPAQNSKNKVNKKYWVALVCLHFEHISLLQVPLLVHMVQKIRRHGRDLRTAVTHVRSMLASQANSFCTTRRKPDGSRRCTHTVYSGCIMAALSRSTASMEAGGVVWPCEWAPVFLAVSLPPRSVGAREALRHAAPAGLPSSSSPRVQTRNARTCTHTHARTCAHTHADTHTRIRRHITHAALSLALVG